MNAFGRRLRIQLFGESHGAGVGCVLDGVPPGIAIDEAAIQVRMETRRPGTGPLVSSRKETDQVEFLAGVFAGRTTGAPLTIWIANQDTRSKDYEALRRTPRPGHSDLVAHAWSRGHYDHRGGGHYSGRLTAPLVAAAAVLSPHLEAQGIRVGAHVHQVSVHAGEADQHDVAAMRRSDASPVHTAHRALEQTFLDTIEAARRDKDSVGGVVEWKAEGVPMAWGDPFFDSVESHLAHLLFAVPAVKGVSFGSGFAAAAMLGSQHNDAYRMTAQGPRPISNHAGGILGGRTDGAPLWGHVAIKPTSSIFQPQQTVDLEAQTDTTLELKGRHDPCIAVRAAPVVRACIELGLFDLWLLARQEGHA